MKEKDVNENKGNENESGVKETIHVIDEVHTIGDKEDKGKGSFVN